MSKATPAARKVASKVAYRLEKQARWLWQEEARLTAAAASGTDPEAAALAAVFACVCVDRIHPAIAALRAAAQPKRRPEAESEDDEPPPASLFGKLRAALREPPPEAPSETRSRA